ncbi:MULTISPECIES: TIGR03790 family protein [unclassified Duganella]|uniref:TIGR03790 family protein n=1 Tax=unclassified Duganella TaxID=2636909 RepID=UPI0008844854|nr:MULTISPECIES: TIGR03790 family protein [unclassified Duganella]SDH36519.1 TIGR03790 family protein [Duganella sp. OV458]SDK52873.1 TIGR03790 family protein [Duganella sp. OV510]
MASATDSGALRASQLALVINDDDPLSVEIGEYYRNARAVPEQNVVHVRIPNRPRRLNAEQFRQLKEQIDAKLSPQIQAVLMVWTAPYAVECNAITAAYTLGLDAALCQKPCAPSKPSPYFNATGGQPFKEHGMRLSMLLPTESVAAAKALIERGVASGFSVPTANAWYLTTSETARNSRAPLFPRAGQLPARKLTIRHLQADSLEGQSDIIIYQTGMARVAKLDTLRFLPGALADHLTSTGGDLLSDSQMSSLRWLDAGATASYGTVTEPCNYWQKFPQPTVLLRQYLLGNTAIEAYWKSVAWPAQGVFIGEPLAAPYRR